MKGTIVGLFLAIFFLYFVASRFGLVSVSYSLNSTLRQIPNAHWSSSFSSIYQLKLKLDSCENRTRLALHRRLGPVVRIAPQELSVNIIEGGVSTIFGLKYFDRSEFYKRAFRQNDDVYVCLYTSVYSANSNEPVHAHVYKAARALCAKEDAHRTIYQIQHLSLFQCRSSHHKLVCSIEAADRCSRFNQHSSRYLGKVQVLFHGHDHSLDIWT